MASNTEIIDTTILYVKQTLRHAEGGHDWFHTERVYKNSLLIAKTEPVDVFVVSLAALLHDIADSKFYNGDDTIGAKKAHQFLFDLHVDSKVIEQVVYIIEHMSFKHTLENNLTLKSKEFEVVQDADRLDAMGAIGIARCFNYGGFKNRPIYNPEIKPNLRMSKEAYKNSVAPTINHFYEKLLLLKDGMLTQTGKEIAHKRHVFMESYLTQFYNEWYGRL